MGLTEDCINVEKGIQDLKCVFDILRVKKREILCLNKVDLQHKMPNIFIDIQRELMDINACNLHQYHYALLLANNSSKQASELL